MWILSKYSFDIINLYYTHVSVILLFWSCQAATESPAVYIYFLIIWPNINLTIIKTLYMKENESTGPSKWTTLSAQAGKENKLCFMYAIVRQSHRVDRDY